MIQKGFYKDRPAFIVKGKELEAKILPEDGAKLASLKTGSGRQLLEEAPGEAYRRLTLSGSYVEAECSAFDDMFPTIDPCDTAGFVYPDHGDVCRVPRRQAPGPIPRLTGRYTATLRVYLPLSRRLSPRRPRTKPSLRSAST